MGNDFLHPPRPKKPAVRSVVEPAPTTLDPTQLPGPVERRGFAALSNVDLGEVAVGSRRWFDVCSLIVADGFRGQAAVLGYVADEAFLAATSDASSRSGQQHAFVTDATPQRVLSTEALEPLRVRFNPTLAGTYNAKLAFRADWSDHRVDQQDVIVRARAVPLEDFEVMPSISTAHDPIPEQAEQAEKDALRGRLAARDQLLVATTEASAAAQALGKAQREGVTNAEKEAKSFKQPSPEAAWWFELAEIAISMGTATIASILSRKITDMAVTRVFGKAVKDVKELAPYYSVVDAIKEGVKSTRKATSIQPGKADKAAEDPQPAKGHQTFSSNREIDFWAHQADETNDNGDAHAQLVADTQAAMLALVDDQSATSVAVMRGLRDVFRAAKEQATIEQQLASGSQWVAGVARASLDTVRSRRTSSSLDPALEDELYRRADGVVQLFVTIDEDAASIEDARVELTRASVDGISQEIADKLETRPLGQFPMPVIIEVAPGGYSLMGATIRREADGSLHASGALPYVTESDDPSVRANVVAQIAGKVLTRPIRHDDIAKGPTLVTNDESKDADP